MNSITWIDRYTISRTYFDVLEVVFKWLSQESTHVNTFGIPSPCREGRLTFLVKSNL